MEYFMKYTISHIDENHLCFTITIPAIEYDKSIRLYVKDHAGEYHLPGIRPEKVTAKMVETMRGRDALVAPVINQLISEAYAKAANEYPDQIYYTPSLKILKEGPGKDLVCAASVQIAPEVVLGDYKSIVLSEEELASAETDALATPEPNRADTRRYLLQSAFINHLTEISSCEIPDTMAEERAEQILAAFDQQLGNNGADLETYYKECNTTEEDLFKDFKEQAKQQLCMRMTLLELAKAEGLLATEEEYSNELERLSEMYLMTADRLREIFAAREGSKVKQDISIAKAADFVAGLIDELYPAK